MQLRPTRPHVCVWCQAQGTQVLSSFIRSASIPKAPTHGGQALSQGPGCDGSQTLQFLWPTDMHKHEFHAHRVRYSRVAAPEQPEWHLEGFLEEVSAKSPTMHSGLCSLLWFLATQEELQGYSRQEQLNLR